MMTTCASARSRDCMSGPQAMDIDLRQQLIYMQMSIKEIGASLISMERKVDSTGHSISSVEQQLLQMKQLQIFAKMEKGPSLVELDNMLKKNFQQAFQGEPGPRRSDADNLAITPHQMEIHSQHMDSLKRLEEGVHDLLSRSQQPGRPENKFTSSDFSLGAGGGQGQLAQEGKAGAADYVTGNVRYHVNQELNTFQASIMKDFQAQQDHLMKYLQEIHQKEMYEFQALKMQPQVGGSQDIHNIRNLAQVRGDANETPRDDGCTPRVDAMSNVIAPTSQFGSYMDSMSMDKLMPIPARAVGEDSLATSDGAMTDGADGKPRTSVNSMDTAALEADNDDGDDEDAHIGSKVELKEDSSLAAVFCNDDDVESPPYNVEDFYYTHGMCQKIARSNFFANFTVFVVVLNAVYIGVDSDYNDSQNIYTAHFFFQACSQFFALYFTFELVVRLLAFENKHNCLKDGWFKFDAFLVSTMILDIWILMTVLYIVGGGVQIPTQPLRMLRLFKLTRMARLMKAFPELVTMIKGLVRSLRAISSSMILIGLMVYVWAIVMHMLMKEEDEFNSMLWEESFLSFETITSCIWTLLMAGTLMLDDSAPLMTELLFSGKFNYLLAGMFFVSYALLSAMLILQMLIGVLCDVVSRVGSEQRDATAIGLVKQELLSDLKRFDGGDGKISQKELRRVMNSPESKRLLRKLDINRGFLLELQKMMFTKPGQQVTIKSVLELMIMCRGENPTTVQSMAGGLLSVIREVGEVKCILENDLTKMKESIEATVRKSVQLSV